MAGLRGAAAVAERQNLSAPTERGDDCRGGGIRCGLQRSDAGFDDFQMLAEMSGEVLWRHARIIRVTVPTASPATSATAPASTTLRVSTGAVPRSVPSSMSMVAAAAMSPELRGNLADVPLRLRQQRPIVGRFFDFVRRPRLGQPVLELVEGVRAHRPALPTQHHESYWPVESRDLELGQGARDFFG